MNDTTTITVRYHVTISRNLHGEWAMGNRWKIDVRDDEGRSKYMPSLQNEAMTRLLARWKARRFCRALAGVRAMSEKWTYEAEIDQ